MTVICHIIETVHTTYVSFEYILKSHNFSWENFQSQGEREIEREREREKLEKGR